MLRPSASVLLGYFTLVNIFIYLDRGIIPGAPQEFSDFIIKNELGTATDVWFGLLQSAFIAGLSVSSLVFGHLLHYFSGFWLMGVGLTMWSCAVLLSGFSGVVESYSLLLVARILSGVGEASYASIAPVFICDNAGDKQGLWIAIFYTAIPLGTALGYIYSAVVANAAGWRFAFFIEGFIVLVLALLCFWIPEDAFPIRKNKPATHSKQPQSQSQSTQEPATATTEASLTSPSPPPSSATHTDMPSPSASPRENDRAPLLDGVHHPTYTTNNLAEAAKGSAREVTVGQDGVLSSPCADDGGGEEGKAASPPSVVEELLAVVTAPSFLVLTWGYAAYAAATMGFSTFGSSFLMGLGFFRHETSASSVFGAMVSLAGILGTPLGGVLADRWEMREEHRQGTEGMHRDMDGVTPRNEEEEKETEYMRNLRLSSVTFIMTVASLVAFLIFIPSVYMTTPFGFLGGFFLGMIVLFMTQGLMNLGLLLAVPPENRSFAFALATILLHLLGDVPSPVLIGMIKDRLAPHCTLKDPSKDTPARRLQCGKERMGLRFTLLILVWWFAWMWLSFGIVFLQARLRCRRLMQQQDKDATQKNPTTTADPPQLDDRPAHV
ncbi:unnamed protein product [Vitrella brassicaformis CCMP3155]|uniref:Major facilitator superfamily (MFS) profile domain-containing protein n=1 Tax=Vitrella brassicaformis (strain CCMP3155) TaxID=1169540 RepID=A0A0G4EI18_VITBC|nr:unnamed protein product [Vitrella brassicaformis CCMP3155]|eukprot:CEL96623.1 unnamed protein product [Vitrella brassicaformis CCMP3155]